MTARRNSRGMSGHHSAKAKTDVWLTPPEIIAALGPFDLDPCSPMPRPWRTARAHYYRPIDGLTAPWAGRVWLNPPYGNAVIGAWLKRLADHGRGTALIFARTETENFVRQVWRRAEGLLFIEGRLYFHRQDGTRAEANAGAPSVLCGYGQRDAEILASCGLAGTFVPLRLPQVFVTAALSPTWREAVLDWLSRQSGPVPVAEVYRALAAHPKARGRQHWQAKVRQTLQRGAGRRVGPDQWVAA